jgi:CHAT domain-containing protein
MQGGSPLVNGPRALSATPGLPRGRLAGPLAALVAFCALAGHPAASAAQVAEALVDALVAAPDRPARTRVLADAGEAWTEALEQALVARAEARENEGLWREAAAVYGVVLDLAEAAADKAAMAEALRDLGYAAGEQEDPAAAAGFQRRALALAEELGDELGQFKSHNNLGNAYSDLGDLRAALVHYQRALQLAGDGPYLVAILTNLGGAHLSLGDTRAARATLERALERADATADPFDAMEPLNNLGALYAELGDRAKALAAFRRFSKLAEEAGARSRAALALNNIGNILTVERRYAEAREQLERSARLAAEIGDRRTLLLGHKDLGRLALAERRLDDALRSGEECTALARAAGQLETLWVCRAIVGLACRELGRPLEARAAYEEAVAITESLSAAAAGGAPLQTRFYEDKTASYYGMVMLLVAAERPLEAFAWAERVKGRVLLELLRSGARGVGASLSAEERAEEERLSEALVLANRRLQAVRAQGGAAALAEATAALAEARLEHEAFLTRLEAAHPWLRVGRGELQLPSLEDAAALVGPGTALVEYAVGNEAAFAFVLSRAEGAAPRLEVVRLDTHREQLVRDVADLRAELAARRAGYLPQARRLYDVLVRPLEPLVGGSGLLIVPDGPLWELPFQALVRGRSHLLELRALHYAPSLAVLAEMTRSRADEPGSGLLAMGDPRLGPGAKPLPETRQEVAALEPLYSPSLVLVGVDAREETWKREAPRAGVLHLASHAVLDGEDPMYSHVRLASAEGQAEDGLLEAREILGLELRAELAVLSACETGRGRASKGEGLVGMAWAFFAAGCPATLVSHWKVDSASTTQLMIAFHRALAGPGETSKAEALRSAALALMREQAWRHPFYWAGFSVVGSNAPLRRR